MWSMRPNACCTGKGAGRNMATNILMPALSPTMTEGTLARWLKNEGDLVRAGDIIAEIETDKATMEVEAVDEGVLGKILVPGGTAGVKVNEVIAGGEGRGVFGRCCCAGGGCGCGAGCGGRCGAGCGAW
jgi:Biotin-requiring enzyme